MYTYTFTRLPSNLPAVFTVLVIIIIIIVITCFFPLPRSVARRETARNRFKYHKKTCYRKRKKSILRVGYCVMILRVFTTQFFARRLGRWETEYLYRTHVCDVFIFSRLDFLFVVVQCQIRVQTDYGSVRNLYLFSFLSNRQC